MKVWKPRPALVEIGPLKAAVELPSAARVRHGMNMTCAACRKKIEEPTFAGGFVDGHPNLILHVACVPDGTPWPQRAALAAPQDGGGR